ncbi:MAG: EamA family transporter [Candidatus Micrarchaeota archaeon]|nr:EamA family transporter [Candidatus Micrarchaeota archaeon]
MIELFPLLFGLGTAISWALYDYLSSKLAKRIGYQRAFFENNISAAAILFIPFLLAGQFVLPTSQNSLAVLLGVSILSVIGSTLLYKSFQLGKVSINSPIGSLYSVVAVLIVAIITKSTMPLFKIALAMAALLFASVSAFQTFNFKEYKLEKGVALALLAAVAFTATSTLPALVKSEFNEFTYAFSLTAIGAVLLGAMNKEKLIKWIKAISMEGCIIGLLYSIGWILYLAGINSANSTFAVALSGLFPAIVVLITAARKEEPLATHQKLGLAAMIVTLAAFLLY